MSCFIDPGVGCAFQNLIMSSSPESLVSSSSEVVTDSSSKAAENSICSWLLAIIKLLREILNRLELY